MLAKLKNKKGFTLIELIVVIAVLSILVLLAAPKFLGHTEEAKLAQIKNDVKAHENYLEAERAKVLAKDGDDIFLDLGAIAYHHHLEYYIDEGLVYSKKGPVTDYAELKSYTVDYVAVKSEISSNKVKSKLKGTFILSENGNVFYIDDDYNPDYE